MLSGKTVTVLLLSITAVGLFAVTGYNLRHGPVLPEPVAVSESSEPFPELETPVTPDAEHPLDLNMATAEELMRLPGIGEVLAERILAYREETGGFSDPEELLKIKGIGEATLEELHPIVIVK